MKKQIDILIKDGLVYNGSGEPPCVNDIAVCGDKILSVGKFYEHDAAMTISARGMVVAPGFIDSHAHSDFTLVADPRAEGKISQGVTTEIIGNCGMSAAPLYGAVVERRESDLVELGIAERWNSVAEYRAIIERRGIALNIAMLVGHGNVRASVMGYEDGNPSEDDLRVMKRLLSDALREGGIGLSTGLIYPPGVYSLTDEISFMAGVLKEYDMVYTSHMRSEGDHLLEAIKEVVSIAQTAGIRAHISHIKTSGEQNWGKADNAIELILSSRSAGLEITCDRYPYIASSTDLDSILPSWVYAGGNDDELRRLSDDNARKNIRQELETRSFGRSYWERILISSVVSDKNAWMEGLTVAAIANSLGADEIDAVFRILTEEKLRAGAIFFSMNEENLKKFLSLSFCCIGSDSSARCLDGPTKTGKPHPRTFGTFARFLSKYVRDESIMPLEEAIRRMTKLPAAIFGLKGRGEIRDGYFADLVIFDPSSIQDRSTYESPFRLPSGIAYVIVNGVPVIADGVSATKMAGRFLVR